MTCLHIAGKLAYFTIASVLSEYVLTSAFIPQLVLSVRLFFCFNDPYHC